MCCGKPSEEVGAISWRGNCLACAVALEEENNNGIAEQRGYPFRRHLNGLERYIAKARLDLAERSP
jgi:hypothetical protein